MRVTHRMMVDNAIHNMSENLEQLGALQTKAASSKRFQKASDEPGAARAALSLRSSVQATQAYLDTAYSTDDWMSATEVALGQVVDIATQAINMALEGLSDSKSETRPIVAQELDDLLQEAIGSANTSHQGNYIFAGYKTQTKPFTLLPGSPDTVAYNGDSGVIQRDLGPGHIMTVNVDGDAALSPLFAAIIGARDALNADDTATLQTMVTDLHTALDTIIETRSLNGARQRQVNASADHLANTQYSLKSLLSQKEDTNLVEVISELRHQEIVYQAVLEVGNRTLATLNLFDLMS